MATKSLRKKWQREKLEREQYERSFPIVSFERQPDGSYIKREVAWRS